MSEKLKPCPFCGSEAEQVPEEYLGEGVTVMSDCYTCSNENCPVNEVVFHFPKNWNTRPIEDEQAKLIEQLKDAIDVLGLKYLVYTEEEANKFVETAVKAYQQWKDKHIA